jgi:hypothetical protein
MTPPERIRVRLVSTGQVIREDPQVARARVLDGTAELVDPADAQRLNLAPAKAQAETTALEPREEMAVSAAHNPPRKGHAGRSTPVLRTRTIAEICRELGGLLDELATLRPPVPEAANKLVTEARIPNDVALWLARILLVRAQVQAEGPQREK